jgi:exosortase family protein XrtG
MNILYGLCFLFWAYFLTVLTRAKLYFYKFLAGSVGLFFFMLLLFQSLLTTVLCRVVAALVGIIGQLSGCFQAYDQYALILIPITNGTVSMYIDYECSGVVEFMAFTALLWFFPLYNISEKVIYNIVGIAWILLSNILRLFVISILIHNYGNSIFYFAHTIFGRIIFYLLTIILYYFVFTKPQISRQKVGDFGYEQPVQ